MSTYLLKNFPQLYAELHPSLNIGVDADNLTLNSKKELWWVCSQGHQWIKSIQQRSLGRTCPTCNGKQILVGYNDLNTTHPDLAAQWHPTKNNTFSPQQFTSKSVKKVWWLGDCSHEWEAAIKNRSNLNNGCPYCSNKKVLTNFNDLKTKNPDLATQWHPTKNNNLTPSNVTAGTTTKVWWLGDCGHEWEATVKSRNSGNGCPVCSGTLTIKGVNDLATTHPQLIKQWHPTKNGELTSDKISYGSTTSVWWVCELGHEWETTVNSRTQTKEISACPVCKGKKILAGFNDLATTHPELTAQWNFVKNNGLTPDKISYGSALSVWWSGDCGHEWETKVYKRTSGRNCPYCAGAQVLAGYNDLATKAPQIAAQWHPTKNKELTPSQIMAGSERKIWWVCNKSHEWEARVNSRVRGSGCPECVYPNYQSAAETILQTFIENFGLLVVTSDRKILKGQELDLYVPEKNIAIEYNGLYWHSENAGKDRKYHYNKWLACKEQGIQLIQVWEDDWVKNPEQIKRMLAHKLGVSQEPKIYARKTAVQVLTKHNAEQFLNENHIQGYSNGSYYLGLTEKRDIENKLLAVLVLKKEAGTNGETLNIIRYATNATVVGGFTKLLTYAEKTYQPEKFVTFSDNCVSDGALYRNNNFIVEKQLDPDYMYVANHVRYHKFGYRLKRFRSDPNLLWDETLSERELALLNNVPRIWDAGKTKWVKNLTNNET